MSNRELSEKDTQHLIGQLLPETAGRDAIHIAVAPVVAKERVSPGQNVGVDGTSTCPHVGIVDPYLVTDVLPGGRFFIFLYPGTINTLRHQWTHPEFDKEGPLIRPLSDARAEAKAWIAQHADELGLSMGRLMEHAKTWLEDPNEWPEYVVEKGSEHWRNTFDPDGFWPRYELLTGVTVREGRRESFFSCSC